MLCLLQHEVLPGKLKETRYLFEENAMNAQLKVPMR